MKKSSGMNLGAIGHWIFIAAVVIAILAGFTAYARGTLAISILVILGIIVGLVNVTEKEVMRYLLAAIGLMIVAGLGSAVLGTVQYVGIYMQRMLSAIMIFVIPATVVVALSEIYKIAAKR